MKTFTCVAAIAGLLLGQCVCDAGFQQKQAPRPPAAKSGAHQAKKSGAHQQKRASGQQQRSGARPTPARNGAHQAPKNGAKPAITAPAPVGPLL